MSTSTCPDQDVPVAIENDHGPTCQEYGRCVECQGCDCGLIQRTCSPEGGGCYSQAQAQHDQDRDDYDDGGDWFDDDWYRDIDDDDDVEHDDGDGAGCDCPCC